MVGWPKALYAHLSLIVVNGFMMSFAVGASVFARGMLVPIKSWVIFFAVGLRRKGHPSCTGKVMLIVVLFQDVRIRVVVIPCLGGWMDVIAWVGAMIVAIVFYWVVKGFTAQVSVIPICGRLRIQMICVIFSGRMVGTASISASVPG